MPAYDFKCKLCGKTTTVIQKVSESTNEIPCPECEDVAVKVLTAPAGFKYGGVSFSASSDKKRK